MKKCTKCRETKTLDCFSKNKNKKDGLECQCKDCKSKYYFENKAERSQKGKEYYKVNRVERRKKIAQNYQDRINRNK